MEENEAKISVITLIYNVEKYIEKCVEALFSQTMENIEYIFVNDATPDRSMSVLFQVLDRYPERKPWIKIVEYEMNQGIGIARSAGLKKATAPYIIYIDSDDYCEASMLEDLYLEALRTNADIVICDYYVNFNGQSQQIYKKQETKVDRDSLINNILSGKLHASLGNKLVARKLYVENHIDFIAGVNMWEDLYVVIQLISNACVVSYMPKAYLHYVQYYNDSATNSISEKSLNEMVVVTNQISNFIQKEYGCDSFTSSMNYLKLIVKKEWITNVCKDNLIVAANLYSEANNYILSHPVLPFYMKIVLKQAVKHNFNLVLFVNGVVQFMKRILRG